MIKANDFRIGNYVYYKHPTTDLLIHKIEWLDFKEINEFPDIYNEYHKPIQLTEEILIKCGFVLYGYGSTDDEFISSVEFTGYRLNNFDICFVNDTNKSIRFVNNINEKVYCNIKYLHQLQNLYFALTNEEITIQL
jgi:hypothetical protein